MKIKSIYFNLILILAALSLLGCVDNEPKIEEIPNEKVNFEYKVNGDYAIQYYIGSDIQFMNISSEKGALTWNFGDGSPVSNEENPTHKYQEPGIYQVTLTIDNIGYKRQPIMISDITPMIKTNISTPVCIIEESKISFDTELPNPEGIEEYYLWVFPEGTKDSDGNIIKQSTLKDPGEISFSNVGSQRVILKTKLGDRKLPDVGVNVQVGYNKPVKTLYYAAKGGNIMAYKIIDDAPQGMTNSPFDLGAKSGQHPFNIFYREPSVYVLDAGKQFTYVNDIDKNLGDGKINVISKDGSSVETMIDNIGGYAFDDPYFGYMDTLSNVLHFTDRNTGIARISLDKRNEKINRSAYPYWVQNNRTGYYGNGIAYGAGNAGITLVGDTWWWCKSFLSMGIFRFKSSDVATVDVESGKVPAPASGIGLANIAVKSVVVDTKIGVAYLTIPSSDAIAGFYKIPLDVVGSISTESALKPYLIQLLPADGEGSTEMVHVSQLVIDNSTGNVYFAYRAPVANQTLKSGIKCYNPQTNKIESVIDGVEAYGITLNDRKTQLF